MIFWAPCSTGRQSTDDVLRSSGHWEGELVNTKRDGTQFIVASRWSMQRDDRGQPIGTWRPTTT